MSATTVQLKSGLVAGVRKGWHYFIWTCKVIIPVSLVVTVLQWSGWLAEADFLMAPLMSLLGLPPEAALPILSGIFINLYAVVAVFAVVPFSPAQMTLIAVFNLIAHAFFLEALVQHRSGLNWFKAVAFRIVFAVLTVLAVAPFIGDASQPVVLPASLTSATPVLAVLKDWVIATVLLLLRIFGIVMFIMILQECFKALGWLEKIRHSFRHFVRVMGLSQNTATLWLTGIIFGLFYSGAVLIEEARKGHLGKDELERLHISLGINHSMTEDPTLFAVIGLPPFWMWVPRFITAIVAVQLYRLAKLAWVRLRAA